MTFNSPVFLFVLLPTALIGVWIFGRVGGLRAVVLWLVVVSLFRYGYAQPDFLFLLCGSILANYMLGARLAGRRSRPILIVGVGLNLTILAYFKYAGFFVDSVDSMLNLDISVPKVVLPLAISFYTFQQIAYLVDTYRGDDTGKDFLSYILFISFFPTLLAGPIVRQREFSPQLGRTSSAFSLHLPDLLAGAAIFVVGLEKKLIFADGLAVYADAAFTAAASQEPTFVAAWIGALSYTLQIYFDFSGYSDMAIGLARMLGVRLPQNFESPYKATSIVDFWRRWHITLSRFLRDYLYIPLGGNRQGFGRQQINILITMILGGLWHGAAWTFLVWGALHGIFLAVNHLWRSVRALLGHDLAVSTLPGRIAGRGLTFICVVFAWVFFRADSFATAWSMLSGMAGLNGIAAEVTAVDGDLLIWLGGLLAVVHLAPNTREMGLRMNTDWTLTRLRVPVMPVLAVSGIVGLLIVVAKGSLGANFIYMVF